MITILITVSIIAKSVTLLFNFMFIFEARNIENKKLITFVVVMQVLIVGIIIIGCMQGVVPNWTYNIGGRYRESLGFFYPNRISSLYFFIVLAICYLKSEKLRISHILIMETLNLVIYRFTNTRMAFALTTITIFVFFIMKYRKKKLRNTPLSRILYLHSLYLIPVFAILLCFLYSPASKLLDLINTVISNRLLMGHDALFTYPITLFGQHIEWIGFGGFGYIFTQLPGKYNAVDCAYVKILLNNGLLIFLMAIVGYIMSSYNELKQGNRAFCLAILLMSIYCLIEPLYIETGFNPFVWTLSVLLTKKFALKRRRGHVFFDLKDVRRRHIRFNQIGD